MPEFNDLAAAGKYIDKLEKDINELKDFKKKQEKVRLNDILTGVASVTGTPNSGDATTDGIINSLIKNFNMLKSNIEKQ